MINALRKFMKDRKQSETRESVDGHSLLHAEQQENFEHDRSIVFSGDDGVHEERVQKEAEKEVRSAAEDSLKELHIIRQGRCPKCGGRLNQHLFSAICGNCGWHSYETPLSGPVRVHLKDSSDSIEGERCYIVKPDAVLVIRQGVVFAKIPASSVAWIEYVWTPEEVRQRQRQMLNTMKIRCGWCGNDVDPDKEGFHLTHISFGATQERYCFCSDECYEAFRKLYPARVHRNCYDRPCSGCDLCDKRYPEGGDGIFMFMKDYLLAPSRKQ